MIGSAEYFLIPIVTYWMAAHIASWGTRLFWDSQSKGLLSGLVFLLLLTSIVYDLGYKKYFMFGRRKYFYTVYAAPLGLALVGWGYEFLMG